MQNEQFLGNKIFYNKENLDWIEPRRFNWFRKLGASWTLTIKRGQ